MTREEAWEKLHEAKSPDRIQACALAAIAFELHHLNCTLTEHYRPESQERRRAAAQAAAQRNPLRRY